jgi:hypothetical protein
MSNTITVTSPSSPNAIYTTTSIQPGSITITNPSGKLAGSPGTITTNITGNELDWNDPTCKYMQIGDAQLREQDIFDILDLVKTINELDDNNPIKEMYENIKMLNKIKGKK